MPAATGSARGGVRREDLKDDLVVLIEAELAGLPVAGNLHDLIGEGVEKASAVDLDPGGPWGDGWDNKRCPAIGHPVEISLSKGREHPLGGQHPGRSRP